MNRRLLLLCILLLLLCIGFVFYGAEGDWHYILSKRFLRLGAIAVAACCVACSAIIFQSLVGHRILTPAVMGYEAVYLLWQSLLLYVLGSAGLTLLGSLGQFVLGALLMLLYSLLLQRTVLARAQTDVYQLLLLGLVLSMVMLTISQFIQLKISPGEFTVFQGLSYASFNRVRPDTLLISTTVLLVILYFIRSGCAVLDVMALGREQALSLGVNHQGYLRFYMALLAVLVAISTSLIGPVAFMGIFIANIAYALAQRHRHALTLAFGCVVAMVIFLTAQLLVEHLFNYKTTVSILINLLCGIYFLGLMLYRRGSIT
ncbi:iron chelate uptake ABC transporter family permease subunit [Acinetobacter larvae]|uniref:Iron ABC transporter permease n=1 Tax=Acinetobacter larvae TaxID=1789224 RepID=A0A1B2LYR5_9GAMM|nr:iron chelate uptake ABC transporter family permease subunit [Acinetobacter larvae]AOA58102.1 iron ABC transporter permease [Acinetobacter larvae]